MRPREFQSLYMAVCVSFCTSERDNQSLLSWADDKVGLALLPYRFKDLEKKDTELKPFNNMSAWQGHLY